MLTKPALHYMGLVGIAFGSFVIIEQVAGKIGLYIAIGVFLTYLFKTGATDTIISLFDWVTSLVNEDNKNG